MSKANLRQILINLKVWTLINHTIDTYRIFKWNYFNYSDLPPSLIKRRIIMGYLREHSIKNFIETGTFLGDTLDYISKSGANCFSIELSDDLHNNAIRRFKNRKNVKLILGDSGHMIPSLLQNIKEPYLFWLDGHYSGGFTATSNTQTPISNELQAILDHPIKQHIILIDDARCFDGTNDYPYLDNLLRTVRENGNYKSEVSLDIIRLTPK